MSRLGVLASSCSRLRGLPDANLKVATHIVMFKIAGDDLCVLNREFAKLLYVFKRQVVRRRWGANTARRTPPNKSWHDAVSGVCALSTTFHTTTCFGRI
jgi:hypothetical protein